METSHDSHGLFSDDAFEAVLMLHLLAREFSQYVTPAQRQYYLPYQDALWAMFSPELFPDVIDLD